MYALTRKASLRSYAARGVTCLAEWILNLRSRFYPPGSKCVLIRKHRTKTTARPARSFQIGTSPARKFHTPIFVYIYLCGGGRCADHHGDESKGDHGNLSESSCVLVPAQTLQVSLDSKDVADRLVRICTRLPLQTSAPTTRECWIPE